MRDRKYQLGKAQVGRLKAAWREKTLFYNGAAILVALAIAVPVSLLQRVDAVSDTVAPTLVAGSIASGAVMDTVDTMYPGYNASYADLQVSDNLSGNVAPLLVYTSPSGKQTATGGSNGVEGNTLWSSITNFPQYSEAGIWVPTLYVEDASGNKATYTDAQLQVMGINLEVTLTGVGDTTDPVLVSATRANPGALDVTGFSPAASFVVHMTDNISGLGIPSLYYTSPTGNQTTVSTVCSAIPEVSPTAADYDCEAYFQQHAESGTWTPDMIIVDGAGNTVHYTNANLLAMGIDARVAVTGTSDTTPPVLSSLSITVANPPADNIPYGGAAVTLAGNVSDNLTGINGTSEVRYTSPLGTVVSGSLQTNADGTFTTNVFLPQYTEGGTWQPSVYVQDLAGNSHTYTASDLVSMGSNIALTVSKNITETAVAGGTVTSDYENDGATAANPIEASVTTPSGGAVSIVIVQSNNITNATNGYTFFDRQLSITAPTEDAATPLTLSFMIDSSVIPVGESANTLQITRNGSVVPACTDQTTAAPNPCVFSRQALAGGDIQVQIHTTTASAWASGFPTHNGNYDFTGFIGGTKDYPKVNKVQAGQVVELAMQVKGVPRDVTNILAAGSPVSQQVNCTTLATIGSPVAALSAENEGLSRDGRNGTKFEYEWLTKGSWKNTCRVLTVQLKDGSTQKALFKLQADN